MNFHRLQDRVRRHRLERDWEAHRYCFTQGDGNIANQAGAAFRADLNNELIALYSNSSGASAPGTTQPYQFWVDTTTHVLKQRNAANSGWIVVRTLDESFVLSRSSNTIIGQSDVGKVLVCTGTFTQTVTAAATLGDGFWFGIRNNGTGVITIDPNSTETIDGATTLTVYPGEAFLVYCTGSAFVTLGRGNFTGNIPQNSQSAAYTTVLTDAGKHILHPFADNNPRTFTIDSNANVPYPIGTAITFVNEINTVTIAIDTFGSPTTDTLIWAVDNSTGSRTLAAGGVATALKVTSTKWIISGTGLT